MKALQKILIPIDLSTCSLVGVQYGQEIAELFDVEITLLYVDDAHMKSQSKPINQDEAAESHRRRELVRLIQQLLINNNLVWRNMRIEIRFGSAAPEIVKAARALHADLIVMSTHGRTGLRHVLIGSIAEKVVRLAPCPVLTVKPEEMKELINITEEDVLLSLRAPVGEKHSVSSLQ
jgi:nucleotide-binding universal stress UspA family protein